MPSQQLTFYQRIPTFKDFSDVLEDSNYHEVPEDWFILLTDVRGSTKAIEEGRYKQVNMIGAASITCVLNCLKQTEIPFVFGGDGATLIIPPEAVNEISKQLKGLQLLSKKEFKIDLRVGFVPIRLLRNKKLSLKVAKYELSPGNCLAQFRGGALTRAEEMVKKNLQGAFVLQPNEAEDSPNLEGLSCCLNPLKSKKGQILSLICKTRKSENSEAVLKELLDQLKLILGDDFKSASPVSSDRLWWKWFSPTMADEARFAKQNGSMISAFLKVILKSLLANFSLKMNVPLGPFQPLKYKAELVLNSDFKKFDEMLRMVVDCNPEQIQEIESLLKKYFDQGQIFFGLHKSPEALMTCMVFSASQNQHIHFIDGSQGGYAFAALGLKKQMSQLAE